MERWRCHSAATDLPRPTPRTRVNGVRLGRLKLKPRRTAAHQTGKTPVSTYISELILPLLMEEPSLA